MSSFHYENYWGSLTLTLLNVLGVLNALNVRNMPMDVSLACWALFLSKCTDNFARDKSDSTATAFVATATTVITGNIIASSMRAGISSTP